MGHKDVVQLLLDRGAEPNKGASNGVTPLHMAAYHGHRDIVGILLDNGAVLDELYKVFHQLADWGFIQIQRYEAWPAFQEHKCCRPKTEIYLNFSKPAVCAIEPIRLLALMSL